MIYRFGAVVVGIVDHRHHAAGGESAVGTLC